MWSEDLVGRLREAAPAFFCAPRLGQRAANLAEVALTIRRVLEEPGMEGFRVDFAHEFLETLRAFLYGPKSDRGRI